MCVIFLELLSESEDGSHLVMYDISTGQKESELIPSHKSLQEHCNEVKTSQKVFSQLQVITSTKTCIHATCKGLIIITSTKICTHATCKC